MARIDNMDEALQLIFRTRRTITTRGLDEHTRTITPTRNMLTALDLLAHPREYCVVTGSKGKGSASAITAKVLQSLGHRVGLITSPHLVTWFERIRVDGRAIPEADFLRLLNVIAPYIDAEEAQLSAGQYISPQGVLLAIALMWFDEQGVTTAVIEVGRGGRYDDMSVVPNRVALITPIFLEHTQYLGDRVERIAWHKAGIIKAQGIAYSAPQVPAVLDVLQQEADAQDATLSWLADDVIASAHIADTPTGIRFRLGAYGAVDLPSFGRYQIVNATLAVQAAEAMHQRLTGTAPDIERVQAGLAAVKWHGRVQKLQDSPTIYVDGAANVLSARNLLASLRDRITRPLVTILGIPRDRDVPAVYQQFAAQSDALIITETDIHRNIHFPTADDALAIARQYHDDVAHRQTLPQAIALAKTKAGTNGTVLLAVAQPLVGEAMLIYEVDTRTV